jgi:NADH dehydrogenase
MSSSPRVCAVTGAFGYSGRAIARRLLADDVAVRNLTGHPERADPFGGRVPSVRLDLDDPRALRAALDGADVLINTYWVRFPHGRATHALAVERSARLFAAARDAGVRRVVHTSITNPSPDSPLTYFRGKAAVEEALRATGLPHSILRPAVFFGERDVLLNNIAWAARRLPVFGVPRGDFRIQPIHVDDFARLAVEHAARTDDVAVDAVGPEAPVYRELVATVARAVGSRTRIAAMPRAVVHAGAWILGLVTHDVVLTRQEIDGLADGLLVSRDMPTGATRLSDWLAAESSSLGVEWASELGRHYR